MELQHASQRYFAAANSANGFQSYFQPLFAPLSHVYIIKGGSGTGKSHLMRQFADAAIAHGYEAEYYYCSSDPTSLDGVILPQLNIGILDGTAPHTADPVYPGVVDEIINVGDFWDTHALAKQGEKIKDLIDRKKKLYRQLYRYLSGAAQADQNKQELLSDALQTEKMEKAAKRLLRNYKDGEGYRERHRLVEAIGMDGPFAFDSLEQSAKTLFVLRDPLGFSHLFLEAVRKEAERKLLSVTISFSPLLPERIRVLSIDDYGLCISAIPREQLPSAKTPDHLINLDRFIHREKLRPYRQKFRFCEKCRLAFSEEAYGVLKEIKALHFQLEQCYIDCMDFDQKDAFTKAFLTRVFPD